MRLTIVIPVHNEAQIVEETIRRIANFSAFDRFETVNLVLVENGSSDNSRAVIENLNISSSWPSNLGWLYGTSSSEAGIGHAYSQGAQVAISRGLNSVNDWILWSACDTPFGSSDIESFLAYSDSSEPSPIIIGSKGHHQSSITRSMKRRLITAIFRGLRRTLIGLSIKDTQGTFFIRGDVLASLINRPISRDFFYTTELCFYALKESIKITEVPVVLSPEIRPSTVRPLRDGYRMLKGLLRLRASSRGRKK